MKKKGYSRRGFWGQRIYYDKNGNKKGEAYRNFWGGRNYYDADGNKTGYSLRNFWGGYNRYDNDGNLIGKTYRNFWGGYDSYDKKNRRKTRSFKNFWGGYNHYEDDSYRQAYQESNNVNKNNQIPIRRSTQRVKQKTNLDFSDKAKDIWKIQEIEDIVENSELLKFLMKKKNSLDLQIDEAVSESPSMKELYFLLWSYELYRCVLRSKLTSLQQEKIYASLRKLFKTKEIDVGAFYALKQYFDFCDQAIFWKVLTGKYVINEGNNVKPVTIAFFTQYFRFLVQFELYLNRVFPEFGFGKCIVEEVQKDMFALKRIIAQDVSTVISEEKLTMF